MKRTKYYFISILPFAIIPLLLLIIILYLIHVFGPLSLRHGDPDYVYLLSGVSMGQLHFNIGHIDHPGTPLQIIVGLVTRVTHLFAGKGDYMTDVLSRSDFYLHKVLVFNVFIIAIVLFYMAVKLYKYLDNYLLIILLQLSLLTRWAVINNLLTVIPEVIIIVPVIFLIIRLFIYLRDNNVNTTYKDFLIYSLISGFGLSIKLDYLPLIILPLFVLDNWKQRLMYLPASFICFLLFAFTIIARRNFFIGWVKGLIIHSGKYGQGDSNIIDFKSFIGNIHSLFDFFKGFYIVLILLILFWIIAQLKIFHLKQGRGNKVILGVIITVLFHTLLVAKHFGLNYLMPSIYLFPFMIFLIIYNLTHIKLFRYTLSLIAIVLILFFSYKESIKVLQWKKVQLAEKARIQTDIREIVKKGPFMIMDQPYNFYFQESPLLFGWFFQGENKPMFKESLETIYPATYIFDIRNKKFIFWGDLLSESEILEKHQLIYLFINGNKYDSYQEYITKIQSSAIVECVYLVHTTNDRLFKIVRNR